MATILDVLVDPELRGSAKLVRTRAGVSVGVAGAERLLGFECPEVDEDLGRFICWCVRPANSAESGVRPVKDRANDGRTLGYIFPLTSFAPDSEFSASKLPGRFTRFFAGAAALALVEAGIANRHFSSVSFEQLRDITPLRELFDSDLAVAVLGRENLEGCGLDEIEAQLLVQEAGNFPADLPHEFAWTRPAPTPTSGACSVGRVSRDIAESSDLIGRLVALAAGQSTAVASLLIYYQVVEILSEKVLGARLRKIASAPPADAWDLKESLRDAVSESSRIKLLCAQAQIGDDAMPFVTLRDIGVEILERAGLSPKEDMASAEVLYAIRNLAVHNQKKLDSHAHIQLNRFVSSLHGCIFAMLRRLDLTAL